MQCPSCEFQNMPGSARCARCGASLALATAAIDVHPPRAGRIRRRLPQFWGLRRAWADFCQAVQQPIASRLPEMENTSFDPGTMVRLVVPGWAHMYRGMRERGVLYLAAYFGCLLPGLILLGSWLGSVCIGLAFGIHVMSAVDAMVGQFSDFAGRIAFSLFCGLGLLAVVYLPIGYAISRVATPVQVTQPVGNFARGDVVWYNRSAKIRPGDVVYFEMPGMTIGGRTEAGHAANFVFQGGSISRVVAVAGQTVAAQGGQVLVDGEPITWPIHAPEDIEPFPIGEGRLFIPPSVAYPANAQLPSGTWQRVSNVQADQVHGRIFFRSLPWLRMSTIH